MARPSATAKGFAVLSATGLICKILSLIYVPIQTAVVHDTGNAVISVGLQFYAFMFSLSNAGLPSSISKMVSQQEALGDYRGSKRIFHVAATVLMVLGVTFTVIMLIGAHWFAALCKQPSAYLMLLVISPAFLFTCVNCSIRGYFQGKKNMVPTAVSQVVEQFLNSLFTVTLISLFYYSSSAHQKLRNAAAGSALGTVIGAAGAAAFLVYLYTVSKKQRLRQERLSDYRGPELTTRDILFRIIGYSIPAIVGAVASNASGLIDATTGVPRMMDGGMSNTAASAVYGQYSTIYQRIISLVTFIASALMVALIPAVSSSCALNDRKSLRRTILNSYRALFIFVVPCLAGFTLLAHPIVSAIFFNVRQLGFQFLASWSWTNLLFIVITVQSGIMIGLGKPVSVPLNLIIGMGVKFTLNYLLLSIPSINMNGAAVGAAAGWFVTALLDEYIIIKCSGVKINYIKILFKPVCVSAVMGAVAVLAYRLTNWALVAVLHAGDASRTLARGLKLRQEVKLPGSQAFKLLVCNDFGLIVAILCAAFVYFTLLVLWGGIGKDDILRVPGGKRLLRLITKMPFLKKRLSLTA